MPAWSAPVASVAPAAPGGAVAPAPPPGEVPRERLLTRLRAAPADAGLVVVTNLGTATVTFFNSSLVIEAAASASAS